jgi:hypothetical protein
MSTVANVTKAYMLLTTVTEQCKLFSNHEVSDTNKARALYRLIGRPSETEFQHILKSNFIRNCPVTPSDIKQAKIIYSLNIAVIKGKLTSLTAAP